MNFQVFCPYQCGWAGLEPTSLPIHKQRCRNRPTREPSGYVVICGHCRNDRKSHNAALQRAPEHGHVFRAIRQPIWGDKKESRDQVRLC